MGAGILASYLPRHSRNSNFTSRLTIVPIDGTRMRMRSGLSFALLLVAAVAGCDRTIRTGAIIDQYTHAECIPVSNGLGSPVRTWDYTVHVGQAESIRVEGRATPGGRIQLEYEPDGKDEVAANAGDYIYPADVRQKSGLLYIKASGVTPLNQPQTWLFEYDLLKRRQTQRARVDPSVLPHECPISPR
jgi:hypothetical protein